jgi:hypothetical protein
LSERDCIFTKEKNEDFYSTTIAAVDVGPDDAGRWNLTGIISTRNWLAHKYQ